MVNLTLLCGAQQISVSVNASTLISSFPWTTQWLPHVLRIVMRNEFFFIFVENLIRCNWIKPRINNQSFLIWVQVYIYIIRRLRWRGSYMLYLSTLWWAPWWPKCDYFPSKDAIETAGFKITRGGPHLENKYSVGHLCSFLIREMQFTNPPLLICKK